MAPERGWRDADAIAPNARTEQRAEETILLLEGVDDVRYIATLEKAIKKAGKSGTAGEARQWLEKLKGENPRQQKSWKAQKRPPEDLERIRSRAVSFINQLTQ